MAWSPSPEVAVARDSADRLGKLMGDRIDRCVLLYTTRSGQMGYVSYGSSRAMCDEAKVIADAAFDRTRDLVEEGAVSA